jgi:hypothetical protein
MNIKLFGQAGDLVVYRWCASNIVDYGQQQCFYHLHDAANRVQNNQDNNSLPFLATSFHHSSIDVIREGLAQTWLGYFCSLEALSILKTKMRNETEHPLEERSC